jgi:hypothetical protein
MQWTATLALLFVCLPIMGQNPPTADVDRGIGPRPTLTAPVPTGHRYVVAIGVDHYANPTWQSLSRAVSDAKGFSAVLHDQLGYELAAPPITEKEATREQILSLIDDLYKVLKPGDDLVIFFAGHGTTRTNAVGPPETGFLVPYDAPDQAAGRWSDYIEVDEFLNKINTLPATHILVILDSCHSGIALADGIVKRGALENYKAAMAAETGRVVITSADSSELAADSGGPLPDHSLFTGIMIDGLKTGKADMQGLGFVTSSELGVFVNAQVGLHKDTMQHPRFGRFGSDAGGELLLPTSGDLQSFYKQAYAALVANDRESFLRFAAKADALGSNAPQALWLRYRTKLQSGDVTGADSELQDLESAYDTDHFSRDLVPLDVSNTRDLRFHLRFWSAVFSLPASLGEIQITVERLKAPDPFASRLVDQHDSISKNAEVLQTFTAKPGDTITLPHGAAFALLIRNVSATPLALGLLLVNSAGTLEAAPLDNEMETRGLIQPGKTAEFHAIQTGETETVEQNFVTNPRPIPEFVSPPAGMSRGLTSGPSNLTSGERFVFYLRFE